MGMLVGRVLGGCSETASGIARHCSGVLSIRRCDVGIAAINDVFMLGLARFIAGLGLGGAMPNAAALAAGVRAAAQRPFMTLTIMYPAGWHLAAVLSGQIVPQHGWRAFAVEAPPRSSSGWCFWLLPESPFTLPVVNAPGRTDPSAAKDRP
jgi:MFS family permease